MYYCWLIPGQFSAWAFEQPDNDRRTDGTQFCVTSKLDDTLSPPHYRYSDEDCEQAFRYICSFGKRSKSTFLVLFSFRCLRCSEIQLTTSNTARNIYSKRKNRYYWKHIEQEIPTYSANLSLLKCKLKGFLILSFRVGYRVKELMFVKHLKAVSLQIIYCAI